MDILSLISLMQFHNEPIYVPPKKWFQTGKASIYHIGEKFAKQKPACLWNKQLKDLPNDYSFCAHRFLPCGTILLIKLAKTDAMAHCVVADRGPYGALDKNGKWFIKIKRKTPGKWRGILDMSWGVAKSLNISDGLHKIKISIVK